jgi:TonB dependent receptor.
MYSDLMLNIDKSFGDFRLTSNIGTSFSDYSADMYGYGGQLQLVPNMFTIGNVSPSAGVPSEGGGDQAIRNVALFASVELGWKRMIYLTATGRNDWNSRLVNSAEPSFFYPSVGLSFILSELVDMGKLVDMLKLRASYTQVGAPVSRIGMTPGTYTEEIKGGVIQPNTIYPFGEFKAERTNSYEFGFSFRGLKGVSAEFTYYRSNTYNQTFLGDMPESSGYTKAYLQAGNVQNKGIEASLGYDRQWSDFNFGTNLVFTTNKNEIIEMVKDYKHPALPYTFDIPEVSKGATILKVGGSINDIYANTFLKKDENGYVYVPATGEYSVEKGDPVFLGRATPDFTLGWNLRFGWKGLSMSALINGRFGGIVTSSTQAIMDRFGVSEDSAIARDNGGVMLPGQGLVDARNYYLLTGASGSSDLMGYYTYSATNVRLQQMTLSYRLPSKLFNGTIRGITLSLIGNNLWMIYNKAPHDPELTPSTGTYGIGNDYFMQPSLRSFGASIKLSL